MSMQFVNLTLIATEIAKEAANLPKEFVHKILNHCKDGAKVTGSAMQEVSVRRRMEIKPH
jgi:hypothetical protein